MKTQAEALKDLHDHFDSLEEPMRSKALAYQARLEAEAKVTEGGMVAVILKHVAHAGMTLQDTIHEIQEIQSEHIAKIEIKKAMM